MLNCITPTYQFPQNIDALSLKNKQQSIKSFESILEALDNLFLNSPERKQNYHSKGLYFRSIITLEGRYNFKRRKYIHKATRKPFYYLDQCLGINKYARLSQEVIKKIIIQAADCYSYAQAGRNIIEGIEFSKQTIFNYVKNYKLPELEFKKFTGNYLYINVDGYWINCQNKRSKRELKVASIYTGVETYNNKKRLINKVIVSEEDNTKFAKTLVTTLYERFEINEHTKIFLSGDGACWIKKLIRHLPNAKFVIDKFHIYRAINSLPHSKKIMQGIETGDITILDEIAKIPLDKAQIQNLDYVLNNISYTASYDDPNYLGCHAETLISHTFSQRTRGCPRVWGKNIYKIAYLLSYRHSTATITWDRDYVAKTKTPAITKLHQMCLDLIEKNSKAPSSVFANTQNAYFYSTTTFLKR